MKSEHHVPVAAQAKPATAEKTSLHPRNSQRGRFDVKQLVTGTPGLAAFVSLDDHGDEPIDFADPAPAFIAR